MSTSTVADVVTRTVRAAKYRRFPPPVLSHRHWPDKMLDAPPTWCSVDLRDGNQALPSPMTVEEKLRLFHMLVRLGFKEIEVGFPSASSVEYEFVRRVIVEGICPEDVCIQVLTPARPELIRVTMEAVRGARNLMVHLYNSTSPVQRDLVLGLDRLGTIDLAVRGVEAIRAARPMLSGSHVRFEYSPESFSATEPEFALEICEAVLAAWQPLPGEKVVLNLPSTVEISMPNVYADQIEWFCTNLRHPEHCIVSVHPHNDRGTAVAAAEMAVLAGAQRVEGTLFGNGERTGNVDIVCLAINLLSHGIDPGLDFSNLPAVVAEYEATTHMRVPPRQPYSGELVFTAFSGSHQDAIRKAMGHQSRRTDGLWEVPYLPLDPMDIGRTYEAIIRVNGQSGKGGIAYLMEDMGYHLPRSLQIELRSIVQQVADLEGGEISRRRIRSLFDQHMLRRRGRFRLVGQEIVPPSGSAAWQVRIQIEDRGCLHELAGSGRSTVHAVISALAGRLQECLDDNTLQIHATRLEAEKMILACVEATTPHGQQVAGIGRAAESDHAFVLAAVSLANRLSSAGAADDAHDDAIIARNLQPVLRPTPSAVPDGRLLSSCGAW